MYSYVIQVEEYAIGLEKFLIYDILRTDLKRRNGKTVIDHAIEIY